MAETALCIGLIAFWALVMWALTQLELTRAKRMIRDLEGDLVAMQIAFTGSASTPPAPRRLSNFGGGHER